MTEDTTPLHADAQDPARPSVERLAADAALGVAGVHALGAPVGRAFAGAASRVSGRDAVPGVRVVPLQDRTRVEVSFVADHPVQVRAVAAEVRSRVAAAIADRVDGPLEVDVTVSDVFGPLDRRREEAAAARAARAEELKDRAQDAAEDAKDRAQAVAAEVGDRAAETAATVQVRVQEAREQAADRLEADAAGRSAGRDEGSGDVVVEADAAGAPVAVVEGDPVVVVVTEPDAEGGADADPAGGSGAARS